MESQGTSHELLDVNGCVVTNVIPPLAPPIVAAQCPPIPPTHSFIPILERGIKCRFYTPIRTCLQFKGLGLGLPPKALLSPQLISLKGHRSECHQNWSETNPNPTRNGEPQRRNSKLLNWTMPKTKWSSSKMRIIGRTIGSFSSLHFRGRCRTHSTPRPSKLCPQIFFLQIFMYFLFVTVSKMPEFN